MAVWGTGLYQDDVADDIKIDYEKYFREGLNNEEAYARLLQEYEEIINDPEDQAVFWFVLADIMWRWGKLIDEVKQKALFYIDSGQDIEKWKAEDPKKATKRQQVLKKLREKLESPMPKEKKIGKKRILKNKWAVGDMYTLPIIGNYPRFPEMTFKYLLLIKIGDGEGWSEHIQPCVYIKLLKEKYYEGMDINELEYISRYADGYRFIINNIAGRPLPKELTYVGNYGDLSKLIRPEGEEEEKEILTKNGRYTGNTERVDRLEDICVSTYLMYKLGVDGKTLADGARYLTEEEYQKYEAERAERIKIAEEERYNERKKKEYYICPWNDGDVFFLPFNEEWEEADTLKASGCCGVVWIKIGICEDVLTTNMWPIVVGYTVKKEYKKLEEVVHDKVFQTKYPLKSYYLMHSKKRGIPKDLKYLGNQPDYQDFFIVSSEWERSASYLEIANNLEQDSKKFKRNGEDQTKGRKTDR